MLAFSAKRRAVFPKIGEDVKLVTCDGDGLLS